MKKTIFNMTLLLLLLTGISTTLPAQKIERPQPKFWFGVSGAANFNYYTGTTQTLNSTTKVPAAFHEGFGISPYVSAFFEYRPQPVWGFMFNVAYDARGGKFDEVLAPCNCPANLTTKTDYLSVEPSLRFAPFGGGLYLFIGPAFSYNIKNSFTYTQKLKPDVQGEFSDTRKFMISGQVGVGYDIPLSSRTSRYQFNISPFFSYHPYFGQEPRSSETWSVTTLRAGIALKLGRARVKPQQAMAPPVLEGGAVFTVRAPLMVPAKRRIKETFPMRNYVFFEESSSDIPKRYVKLKKEQAVTFKEGQFQEPEPRDLSGRSERQMSAYYNILNILGDRMRKNPAANVTLIGASAGKGPEAGKVYAESIKTYLVDVFGISAAGITTEGRVQPVHASEHPGGAKEHDLLLEEDRRVDIVSSSMDLIAPVAIVTVQADPLDSRVVFKAEPGKNESLKSWSMEIIDEKGKVQTYGPFTREEISISGNTILGDRKSGDFKVVMLGQTNDATLVRRESTLHLVRNAEIKEEGLRYSVLFDFDKSKTVAEYEKFLTEVVAPLIPNGGTVIIHGHTDIIGDAEHNKTLSEQRSADARKILESALLKAGKTGVRFEAYGFGADTDSALFENQYPEERFYNRTVIIDIVPAS